MTETQRLSKRLIQLTGCSRREAELYIEGGWVSVDGSIVEEPQFQVGEQTVSLHPQANLTAAGPISLVINAPANMGKDATLALLTDENRWPQDNSGLRLLKRHLLHIKPCLALPAGIEGMQVLSQDWRIQGKAQDDGYKIEQEFVVDVLGSLTPEQLQRLNRGLSFQGKPLAPCKVSWLSETRLRFAIKNPAAGQIQHVCQTQGLEVQRIKRIRLGATSLGKMALGQWRYLTQANIF